MSVATARRHRGLGYPWSYVSNDGTGGMDNYPDGCSITYLGKGGVLVWQSESGCSGPVRAPLTDSDLPWIDRSGVRHEAMSPAERVFAYEHQAEVFGGAPGNRAITQEELAKLRAMMGRGSGSDGLARRVYLSPSADVDVIASRPQVTKAATNKPDTVAVAVEAVKVAAGDKVSGVPAWVWVIGAVAVLYVISRMRSM